MDPTSGKTLEAAQGRSEACEGPAPSVEATCKELLLRMVASSLNSTAGVWPAAVEELWCAYPFS